MLWPVNLIRITACLTALIFRPERNVLLVRSGTSLRDLAQRVGVTPVRRPSAFVTTRPRDVLRGAINWIYQPKTTDVFFKRTDS